MRLLFRPRPASACCWPRIRPYAPCKVFVAQVAGECTVAVKIRRSNRSLKGYALQAAATGERPTTDTRHLVGYRYARQVAAIGERIPADTRHAVGYRYARHSPIA